MTVIRSLASILHTSPWRLSLLHSAPYDRVIWTTKGQGRALVGTDRCGIGAHNFIFVPADTAFSLEGGTSLGGFILSDLGQDRLWPDAPRLLRLRDVRDQNAVTGLIDAARLEQDGQQSRVEEALEAHLQLIAIWLHRYIAAHPETATKPSAAQRLIRAFFEELERSYASGEPMATYAERLDVTPTHLSRVCKSALGRSAADLIVERTLHAAREGLETSGHPAKIIAAQLGFGSPAYFTRFIRTHTGSTPRDLRNGPAPRHA